MQGVFVIHEICLLNNIKIINQQIHRLLIEGDAQDLMALDIKQS